MKCDKLKEENKQLKRDLKIAEIFIHNEGKKIKALEDLLKEYEKYPRIKFIKISEVKEVLNK